MDWRLADAKNRFTELVNLALSQGPQRVTRRDDAVIVVAEEEFETLTGHHPSFKRFLLEGPGLDTLDLTRDRSLMRDVTL